MFPQYPPSPAPIAPVESRWPPSLGISSTSDSPRATADTWHASMTDPVVATSGEELVRAENVTKVYPDGDVTALAGVNLSIRRGEFTAIMGPSGSGKSTLLQIVGLLDRPSSGEVFFENRPTSRLRHADRVRAEKIGFVFQSFYLLPMLTALENVQVPMFEGPLPPRLRVEKARELLVQAGIAHRAGHLPQSMSVGERQRVAIARALANDPVLLLADEPTGSLDTKTGQEILALFLRLHRETGTTVVLVTHDPRVAERARRLVQIRDGRIESDERR
jgi:ABC-type lipoprotein export system ATPase subunit